MANQSSGTAVPGYTIIRSIGRGGSAEVFQAVQQNLNRRVALKVVRGTLTSDSRFGERFKREGRIIAQLGHPHIIPVYDIGEHAGHFYMAMEYLSGGDLRSQAERLTVSELLRALLQIAEALQAAHERGFIHRDIKPANILFRNPSQAVLTDFGIARQTESLTQMTVTGALLGTPAYMSPEQIDGKNLDARADLYSLGVTLFEMLTGFQPYRGESIMSVAMQHAHAEIPRLPGKSAHLQALIDRMLAKDPANRIESASGLAIELQSLLDSQQEKLARPLVSLWPDKPPEISEISFPNPALSQAQGTGRLSVKTGLVAGTVVLGLVVAGGVLIRTTMDSSKDLERDSATISEVGSRPVAPTNNDSASQPVVVEKVETEPWREIIAQADQLIDQGRLISPENDNALALYRKVLQQDDDNAIARAGEQNVLRVLMLEVDGLIGNRSFDEADRQLAVLKDLWPDEQNLQRLEKRVADSRRQVAAAKLAAQKAAQQREIENNLQSAAAAMIAGRLVKPEQDSAFFYFNRVLSLEPDNESARLGITRITDALFAQAQAGISSSDFALAQSLVEDIRGIDSRHPRLQALTASIEAASTAHRQQQLEQRQRAELQSAIDALADRYSRWRLSNDRLEEQASSGNQLVTDISRLLDQQPDNNNLRVLYDSATQRLEALSEQRQQQESVHIEREQPPARKPVVGGF